MIPKIDFESKIVIYSSSSLSSSLLSERTSSSSSKTTWGNFLLKNRCESCHSILTIFFVQILQLNFYQEKLIMDVSFSLKTPGIRKPIFHNRMLFSICGTLHSVDQYLNMKLTDITVSDTDRFPHMLSVKNCFIRGSVVRYVQLPSEQVDTQLLADSCRKELVDAKAKQWKLWTGTHIIPCPTLSHFLKIFMFIS